MGRREACESLVVGRRERVVVLGWGKQGVVVLLRKRLRPLEVLMDPESGHCFERWRLLLTLTQHCLVIHTTSTMINN